MHRRTPRSVSFAFVEPMTQHLPANVEYPTHFDTLYASWTGKAENEIRGNRS
jgi:hypothetical protein